MTFATRCVCGNKTESYGGLCDRCVALQALGLDMNASDAQIEGAYRTLVKVWHPDRFQGDPKTRLAADEKLKEINSAHEFLTSEQTTQAQPGADRNKPAAVDNPMVESPPEQEDAQQEPDPGKETAEIRRILRRQRRRTGSIPRFLVQAGFSIGAIAALAILWFVIDAILMANPKTAGPWEQYKAELGRDLHSTGLRMWTDATDSLHNPKDQSAVAPDSAAAPVQQPNSAPASTAPQASQPAGGPPHIKVGGSGQSAQPYVTSGLTPMEVLAILGKPTSSTGEKMVYKGSEIDFRNGRVVGWKVDPNAPIRVKLWPEAAPVPGLNQFALGSPKSDVIALQGTPTLFSDNKFGYGNSVVLFQNDRVVGWHEDPNSVRLRVAH